MKKPSTIRLFLAEGEPEGLWVVEKSNWTGVGLVLPRSAYKRVRGGREELSRAGIYVLAGPSEQNPGTDRIYVGEADVLRKRLDQHHAGKDFWTRAVVFTAKDGSLNKAHARYVESRLVSLAHEAKRVEVENGNAPALPALSEIERADVESFLDDMLMIYPVLGVEAFEKPTVPEGDDQLYLRGPQADARGRDLPEGFMVTAGSTARLEEVPSIHAYLRELRKLLVTQGVLKPVPGALEFTSDHVFKSPSTAAGVLLGRAANGRTEWKDAQGRTLKEIQTAEVQEPFIGT